ncbi:N-acetyllactosaminide beta-1,3-N-acetylglucosaminyltransferase 4 isoform X1 [Hydra vulgaris]|uniref:N-acetyllactosaminide beta-1,3-N-acetylglucosaminyltransferase 4 isoform X1 n=1 Tax=Hydra vulgaris TaxID=6087 RepID=UPI001F5FA2C3|nr:N-acetyllactosaminide beta-1,3-N-acetylglucosaminyltransferase 4-like [Hydra vulgaris]
MSKNLILTIKRTIKRFSKISLLKYFFLGLVVTIAFFVFIELLYLQTKDSLKHAKLIQNLHDINHQLLTSDRNTIANTNNKEDSLSYVIFDSVKRDCNIIYSTLIIITSHVKHVNRRNRIRQTWGNESKWNSGGKYIIVFVVGRISDSDIMMNIAEEAKLWRDIILVNILEDFYTLAKKVIIGLIWANQNIKYKLILKGDDDIYINIINVLAFVKENDIEDAYIGNKIENALVFRSGRYKVSKEEHEIDTYDPYCSGGGYFLSTTSVEKMIPLFDLNHVFRIDDAYIGKIAFKAGIFASHAKGFYMDNASCSYMKDIIVSHPANEIGCINFLLKRFLIDNSKLPKSWSEKQFEKKQCYEANFLCLKSKENYPNETRSSKESH